MAMKKKGQITRERLIEIGQKQMLEASYDSVGIRSITQEAKLPKASFYYYFKSKEDFGKELFCDYMKNYYLIHENYLDKFINPGTSAMDRLNNLYQNFYQRHRKNQWRVPCLLVKIATEVNAKSEPIRQVIQAGTERIIALHEQVIREGQEDSSVLVPEAFDSHTCAELIFNQWKGAVLLSDIQRNSQALDAFFVFLRTLLQGYCSKYDPDGL